MKPIARLFPLPKGKGAIPAMPAISAMHARCGDICDAGNICDAEYICDAGDICENAGFFRSGLLMAKCLPKSRFSSISAC
ncbi:hypothetical protein K0T92_13650 [Paenibacillus oenotherae]|uniref:Uncharacterized protein n=1 Tax=Paenibacillus oenotherae TaxID=1435645 RepID=A0ABS7D7J2_9BACL|nr:hypothetical protein [Paenibacillus oenotherae]MBW7475794.1 hypothetical protein [Paenibacillus oenotherae]